MTTANYNNAEYKEAFKLLMECEGVYSNDSADKGGETKYGFSKRAHPEIDFQQFTWADAEKKAFTDYWVPCGSLQLFQEFSHKDRYAVSVLCERLFNFSFNMGIKQAVKLLQQSCRAVIGENVIEADGVIGNQTMNKIKHILKCGMCHHLICVYKAEAANFYRSIGVGDQKKFLHGWLNRAYRTYYRTGVL